MRFLVDAQLPPALADWLRDKGHAASSVRELGLRELDDGSIWNFACAGGWTVVTKDEDFVARRLAATDGASVIWLRIGNCTNRILFAWLDPLLPAIIERLTSGEPLVEVRKAALRR